MISNERLQQIAAFDFYVSMGEAQCIAKELLALRKTREGWQVVPVEPTERMVIDGFESAPSPIFSEPEEWAKYESMSGCQQAAYKARLCWAAMLAAAPDASILRNIEEMSK